MGGWGSGNRWRYGTKSTTDEYRRLDIRRLAQEGMLRAWSWGTWQWTCDGEVIGSIQIRAEQHRVILMYRQRNAGTEWKDEEYAVAIARTQCNLGGSRPWFICPARGCGRRVAVLYGGAIFACRHCYQLAYPSSREDRGDRATRRADRIRARLGWEAGILNGGGDKPKWMRWRTFERLTLQHGRFVDRAMHAAAVQFGFLDRIRVRK